MLLSFLISRYYPMAISLRQVAIISICIHLCSREVPVTRSERRALTSAEVRSNE